MGRRPKRVSASALEMRIVAADVQVDVYAGSGIQYTIIGPAAQVKTIRANVRGDTLVIEGGTSGSSSGSMTIVSGDVITTGRGRTVVSGGDIGGSTVMSNVFGRGNMTTVIGGDGENAVKITVKVPLGTPVIANQAQGNVVIGDTYGPLTATVQNGGDVYAGYVTSAQLVASSSGDIRVKQVDGPVVATASSSGEITIDDGNMPSLLATANSSADINVGGSATTATLTASSSGDVEVAHVKERPLTSRSSSGNVRVRRVG